MFCPLPHASLCLVVCAFMAPVQSNTKKRNSLPLGTCCKLYLVIWAILFPQLQYCRSILNFHSSLNLLATVINWSLMLFGVREQTLSVVIIKSCTSGLSRVATESWLAYCISSCKPELIQASLTTHLHTNWPKYWTTSVGAEWSVCLCMPLCFCLEICSSTTVTE